MSVSLRVEPDAMDVDEFCERHRISRAGLYALWRAGIGPRFMVYGNRRRISREAAADWRRERETATKLDEKLEAHRGPRGRFHEVT